MPLTEKEKTQKLQEKYQAVLSNLLREEDNKYCVDCDSKGPRWASWNLGIFLCIRCAGIHRNLGVHISRVKSVNLDQWTAEQIASMQAMGNGKARDIYERNLSENFRRSQTDSAMEQFIRAKYEQKKWIAKDWTPGSVTVTADLKEDIESNKMKKSTSKIVISETTKNELLKKNTKPINVSNDVTNNNVTKEAPILIENNLPLVDFDTDFSNDNNNQMNFATFTDDTKYETNTNNIAATITTNKLSSEDNFLNEILKPTENIQPQKTNLVSDLEGLLIGSTNIETNVNKKIDKNSILALYGQTSTKSINSPTANNFQQNNSNNILGMNQQHPHHHHHHQIQQPQQQQANRLFQLNFTPNSQQVLKPSESNNQFNSFQDVSQTSQNTNSLFTANFFDSPKPSNTGQNVSSADIWQ